MSTNSPTPANILDLRQRVLNGEPVSREELKAALTQLREMRASGAAKKSAKVTASKLTAAEGDALLDSLFP